MAGVTVKLVETDKQEMAIVSKEEMGLSLSTCFALFLFLFTPILF